MREFHKNSRFLIKLGHFLHFFEIFSHKNEEMHQKQSKKIWKPGSFPISSHEPTKFFQNTKTVQNRKEKYKNSTKHRIFSYKFLEMPNLCRNLKDCSNFSLKKRKHTLQILYFVQKSKFCANFSEFSNKVKQKHFKNPGYFE